MSPIFENVLLGTRQIVCIFFHFRKRHNGIILTEIEMDFFALLRNFFQRTVEGETPDIWSILIWRGNQKELAYFTGKFVFRQIFGQKDPSLGVTEQNNIVMNIWNHLFKPYFPFFLFGVLRIGHAWHKNLKVLAQNLGHLAFPILPRQKPVFGNFPVFQIIKEFLI